MNHSPHPSQDTSGDVEQLKITGRNQMVFGKHLPKHGFNNTWNLVKNTALELPDLQALAKMFAFYPKEQSFIFVQPKLSKTLYAVL